MHAFSVVMPVTDASHVGSVRRFASGMASRLGLDETIAGQVAIVATELASNLVQHAAGGKLLLRPLTTDRETGIEVLSLDTGRGMRNAQSCVEDGFSTAGTAGNGLGAIRRLSHTFDIYSQIGKGTAVLSQVVAGKGTSKAATMEIGVVSVPAADEEVSGDAWAVQQDRTRCIIALVDGLGHGFAASTAAHEALHVFRDHSRSGPSGILDLAHGALRGTRGAAMAVADIDFSAGQVRYAGVGNISAVGIKPDNERRSMVSFNGTLGHTVSKLAEFTYPWSQDSLLVMHSDGLGTRWALDDYPGLRARHPGIIAGVLYRDFQRGRDDVTVLAARAPAVPRE